MPKLCGLLSALNLCSHFSGSLPQPLAFRLILAMSEFWTVIGTSLTADCCAWPIAGFATAFESNPSPEFSDPGASRWVFKSIVYKSRHSRGFVGFGDADPSNVSASVRGAEMRIAETRAVNRALRKAYGIGLCSVEELGSFTPRQEFRNHGAINNCNRSQNGQPRLRDRLCLLIRQYELDPELVKRYAASFCGTETVSDASRDLVENFIQSLAKEAATNPDALTCKLNSFRVAAEVNS
jgi:hypothetical protein